MDSLDRTRDTSPTSIIGMSIIAVLLCGLVPGGAVARLLLAGLALALTRLSPGLRDRYGLWIAPSLAIVVAVTVCALTLRWLV
jgi:hypothetical protein